MFITQMLHVDGYNYVLLNCLDRITFITLYVPVVNGLNQTPVHSDLLTNTAYRCMSGHMRMPCVIDMALNIISD